MNAPPDPDEVARELLADDQFLTDLGETVRDQHDALRQDLRRLLRIPADQPVGDAELISRIGLGYLAAEAVLREHLAKGGAA